MLQTYLICPTHDEASLVEALPRRLTMPKMAVSTPAGALSATPAGDSFYLLSSPTAHVSPSAASHPGFSQRRFSMPNGGELPSGPLSQPE